jgi:cytochrome c556
MKGNGKALATVLAATAKGDKPYVQADIDAALTVLSDTAAKLPALYPDSVKAAPPSGEFGPSPKVFDDKAGFAKAVADYGAAVTAAKASVKDVDTLKAALPTITKNCSGCHETYRVKL